MLILKKRKAKNSDINFHIKNHSIRNIALNIGMDIRDNDYGVIYKIKKNAGNGYYLAKWTSESYTFQYSHKLVK